MMYIKKYFFLLFLCTLCNNVFGQNISFKAQASSSNIGIDEAFELNFTISNANALSDFTPPKLEGFQILSGPMQSTNEFRESYNGQTYISHSIIISYILKANKTGKLTIPKASAVNAGKTILSNAIQIEVVKKNPNKITQNLRRNPFEGDFQQHRPEPRQELTKAQQKEFGEANLKNNVFIKADVSKKDPYIGEQITVTYKLFTRIPMSVNITDLPSLNGFWSEEYTLPPIPIGREETVNGKLYQVFELKKTALFPQQTGMLTLDPAKASGTAKIPIFQPQKQKYYDDPILNLLMNDPFLDNASNQDFKEIPIELISAPVQIKVKPLPPPPNNNFFNGAVGNFKMSSSIDKNKLTTDEVAKFEIIIEGTGNFKLMGLPTLNFPKELGLSDPEIIDSIVSRNPEIEGYKSITYYINPTQVGNFNIPTITFIYFDPLKNVYNTLQTEAQKVEVHEGNLSISEDMANKTSKDTSTSIYIIIIAIISCVGIVTTYVFLTNKKKQSNTSKQIVISPLESSLQQLEIAQINMEQNNELFYEYISKSIWGFMSQKLEVDFSTISKKNIIQLLRTHNIDTITINNVEKIILKCEEALYAPFKDKEARKELITQTQSVLTTIDKAINSKK